MPKIFLVEDDENIRDLVLYALKAEDMDPYGFEDGRAFFNELSNGLPGLVMLDIMLPGEDGLSILRRLRQNQKTSKLPVIMLTAKGSEFDRISGLDLGADDYIVKPFSMLELISRVNAVLRRAPGTERAEDSLMTFENISLNTERHTVEVDGEPVELTFKEFELLQYMMRNHGIALSREKIMNYIWGFDFEGESRTVDMHINTLRRKIKSAGKLIGTIRGVGYKFGGRWTP